MDIPLPGGGGEVSEDYSPAATVVPFNPPLPLLRAPVPSSSSASTDPMPVLAFRDAASWRAAWEAAEASLFSQCEAGARSGCSITATRKCKPPWWKDQEISKALEKSTRMGNILPLLIEDAKDWAVDVLTDAFTRAEESAKLK
ncbi:hypothetical protein ZWY2020_036610 [Hordeum vulgare]|nr:hypothetical protein ZWY2020_036610 [Hordeum vulgare]